MSGYVRIHRSLLGHHAFRNDAEAMAFAWMVARAAWKPSRVRYKERTITLARGQLAISVRDFAAAHDRDKNWVSRLLKRLQSEDMVRTEAGTGVLVVTICKYEQYQAGEAANGTAVGTLNGTGAGQARDTEQGREEGKEEEGEAEASLVPQLRPEHVVEAWNDMAARLGLAPVRKLSETRLRKLRARMRDHGIDDFTEAISAIERSPFLRGEGRNGWRADFDFLLQPSSFLKLIEGTYDRAH